MLLFSTVSFSEPPADNTNTAPVLDGCIERMAQGDQTAVELLYDLVKVPLYSFAFSILKNPHDAEDVLHDAVLQIWSAAHTYKSAGKPMAWILTVCRNLCMMKLRDGRRTADFSVEELEAHLVTLPGTDAEDRAVIAQCMQKLSDQERQIVVLYAVSGFKHREIAELLNTPLPTVLSKYNRAIKKLKAML